MLLKRPGRDEEMHEHRLRLSDAVRPVRRLVLDRRIPPPVEVDDVRRLREIETKPARFQRQDEEARTPRGLKRLHLSLTFLHRKRAVQKRELARESLLKLVSKPQPDFRILREHQRRLAVLEDRFDQLAEPLELAHPVADEN